jgi:DNA-directed RNA polymerase subunit RPC12/RpoP
MTDEELKARLMTEAAKAIEQVMGDRPAAKAMSLRDIESIAVRAGAAVSGGVQQVLSEAVSQEQDRQEQVCPQCGTRMQRRGERGRRITTEAGTSELERTYYECAACGHHFFSSRRRLGLG